MKTSESMLWCAVGYVNSVIFIIRQYPWYKYLTLLFWTVFYFWKCTSYPTVDAGTTHVRVSASWSLICVSRISSQSLNYVCQCQNNFPCCKIKNCKFCAAAGILSLSILILCTCHSSPLQPIHLKSGFLNNGSFGLGAMGDCTRKLGVHKRKPRQCSRPYQP